MVRIGLFLSLLLFPSLQAALATHLGAGHEHARWRCGSAPRSCVAGGAGSWRDDAAAADRPSPARSPWCRGSGRPTHAGGLFIVFEGVEGAGKGTQIEHGAGRSSSPLGREVVACREPGGTRFGERLRETILDPATGRVDARAEALLFAAARAQLVATVIRPALEEGKVVLCDRFIDSSVAYQGVARGLGEPDILALNAWATQGLFPDLVMLLHVEPDVGLARATGEPDRIESEDAGVPREGRRRVPEDRGGASGAVRRDRRVTAAGERPGGGAGGDREGADARRPSGAARRDGRRQRAGRTPGARSCRR